MEIVSICRIDVDLYRRVTPDIITEDVVITERQIAHIRERHSSDYDRFSAYLPEILTEPDYILEANKPHTALILKQIQENGEAVKLVLRLAVKTDSPDYKNSVITFMRIKDKDWKRLVKNKKILYKREQLCYNAHIRNQRGIRRGGGFRTIHTPLVRTGETRETREKCTPADGSPLISWRQQTGRPFRSPRVFILWPSVLPSF